MYGVEFYIQSASPTRETALQITVALNLTPIPTELKVEYMEKFMIKILELDQMNC
jgi:hypothetical protein